MTTITDPEELYTHLTNVLENVGFDLTMTHSTAAVVEVRDDLLGDFCRAFVKGKRPEVERSPYVANNGRVRYAEEINGLLAVVQTKGGDYLSGVYDTLCWVMGSVAASPLAKVIDEAEQEARFEELTAEHKVLIEDARDLFDRGDDGYINNASMDYARGVVELLVRAMGLDHEGDTERVCQSLGFRPGAAREIYGGRA
jgi:hypothetical protein